jgi:hypothetical protein
MEVFKMKFEISEKFKTGKNEEQILEVLEEQFRKVSRKVTKDGKEIKAKLIEATFLYWFRSDTTNIRLSKKDTGYLCIADVEYKPSVVFWLGCILLLMTAVGLLIPIVAYLYHKKVVREAIEKVLRRVKDEVEE